MIRIINFIFLLLSVQAFAGDTLRAPSVYLIPEDNLIVTLSSDNWSGLSDSIDSKPFRSRGFSFLFMGEKMNKSGNFGFGAGLGFMSQNVHTDAFIDTASGVTVLSKIPDSLDYKLNKLSLNFITAALEIRLRSNENKSINRFKISLGMTAGYLLQSHTKYEDKYGKRKGYAIENLNKFQYGLTCRIGYGRIAASAYYSLVNVFESGKGPELTPYSIGLSFTY
jgi:Outer membrane protein beta-barrel domain